MSFLLCGETVEQKQEERHVVILHAQLSLTTVSAWSFAVLPDYSQQVPPLQSFAVNKFQWKISLTHLHNICPLWHFEPLGETVCCRQEKLLTATRMKSSLKSVACEDGGGVLEESGDGSSLSCFGSKGPCFLHVSITNLCLTETCQSNTRVLEFTTVWVRVWKSFCSV